jgi:hypothetical protein
MYVILPLYGLSIPADEENALFSFQEPKNLRTKESQRKAPPVMGDASVLER